MHCSIARPALLTSHAQHAHAQHAHASDAYMSQGGSPSPSDSHLGEVKAPDIKSVLMPFLRLASTVNVARAPFFSAFRVQVSRRKHLPAALTKQGTTTKHAQRNLPTAGSTGLVGSAPRRCPRLFYYRLRTRSMLCSRCSPRGAHTGSAVNQPRAQSQARHQEHHHLHHHASCRQSTRASGHRIERIVQTASVFGIEPLWRGLSVVARLIAAIAYPVVLAQWCMVQWCLRASSLETSPGKGRQASR